MDKQRVGWVERSETHQLPETPRWVSLRSTHPCNDKISRRIRRTGPAAHPAPRPSIGHLAFAVRRTEHVGLRRQHHVVESLGEHRRGEEGDGAQRFLAGIGL